MSASTATTDPAQLTGDYQLDPAHTRIGFVARHAMVTKVRGSFDEFEGTAHLDGETPADSSVAVTIRAASIDTRNADRDAHLRSDDFLDVERYPEIRFVSTAVEPVDEHTYRLTGDLTIKDVTRPVTIDLEHTGAVVDPWGYLRVGFEGSTVVNRKEWGLTWNAALEAGGVLVGEQVTLEFEVAAVQGS